MAYFTLQNSHRSKEQRKKGYLGKKEVRFIRDPATHTKTNNLVEKEVCVDDASIVDGEQEENRGRCPA